MEQEQMPKELIVAILKNGTAQSVMDAAREVGATGGTVIHAKEIATEYAQKVFRRFNCRGKRTALYYCGC